MEPQMAAIHRDLMAEVGDSFFNYFFFALPAQSTFPTLSRVDINSKTKSRTAVSIRFFVFSGWESPWHCQPARLSRDCMISIIITGRFLHSFHTCCTRSRMFQVNQAVGCSCLVENQVHGRVTEYVLFSKDILSWAFCNFIKKIIKKKQFSVLTEDSYFKNIEIF